MSASARTTEAGPYASLRFQTEKKLPRTIEKKVTFHLRNVTFSIVYNQILEQVSNTEVETAGLDDLAIGIVVGIFTTTERVSSLWAWLLFAWSAFKIWR